jgi:hypothetical protein
LVPFCPREVLAKTFQPLFLTFLSMKQNLKKNKKGNPLKRTS